MIRRAALRGLVGRDTHLTLGEAHYELRRTVLLDALESEDHAAVQMAKIQTLASSLAAGEDKSNAFLEYAKSMFPYWIFKEKEVAVKDTPEDFVKRYKALVAEKKV